MNDKYDALDHFCHALGEPDCTGENYVNMHWKQLSEEIHKFLKDTGNTSANGGGQ